MAVNNNLYPPIINTYMPAFLINSGDIVKDTCRVYFSISSFNSLKDIKNAQVTVSNQYTSVSVLNSSLYPSEIMLTAIYEDVTRTSADRYYIEIKPTDIINSTFEINQYYKVQIRFTGTNASDYSFDPDKPGVQSLDSWLASNLSLFSEWSTVCLIRGISNPNLVIQGIEDFSEITYWSSSNVDIIGNLSFDDPNEIETLKSYRIRLYDNQENLLTDSGILYTNNYNNLNSFIYTLKYGLIDGDLYNIVIDYTTQNLYSDSIEYQIITLNGTGDRLEANISCEIDEENGRIGVNLKALPNTGTFKGNITIRRTSSESNFTLWEDVHTVSIDEDIVLDYMWWDYTITSGVWYKYGAQTRDNQGRRGLIIKTEKPKMIIFDDIFITGNNCQLKWRFNPNISNYKRTVAESVNETIGSKYPFVNRNGYMNYRQFSLSGLITHFMDESGLFTTRDDLYGEDIVSLYDDYNDTNRINPFYDFTYERDFREKVLDFLYANEVRLFRSATEGNILVKLANITLTPDTALGRRIYSLSATVYEIDDFNIENCNKYNIQSLGEYNIHSEYKESQFNSITITVPPNTDVLEVIKEQYSELVEDGYELNIENLDYLIIEMKEQPYLIGDNGGEPYVVEQNAIKMFAATAPHTYLGYLVYINHMPIIINPDGIYTLINENTSVTSFTSPVEMTLSITYNANLNQVATSKKLLGPESLMFVKKVGQCSGGFNYKESLYTKLWNKYYENFDDYEQSLFYLQSVKIEANPGTVVYVKESGDSEYERHVIGQTCLLDFYDDDINLEGLYFAGIHFEEADENESQRDNLPDFKFRETGVTLDSSIDMKWYKLINNGVYTLTDDFIEKYIMNIKQLDNYDDMTIQNSKGSLIKYIDNNFENIMTNQLNNTNNRYIWYNNQWWLFPNTNDLLCNVEALVDYACEILQERYE